MSVVVNRGRYPDLRTFAKTLALSNVAGLLPKALQARMVAWSDVFDNEWFSRHVGSSDRLSAARQFVIGDDLGNAASPLFNADWYRSRYGLKGTPAEALLHYVLVGDRLGLRPHPWFDTKFFRKHYGVGQSTRTALGTFLRNWRAMPIGHPLFDPAWYLAAYPDVAMAEVNPLVHFVSFGAAEGRQPNGFFVPSWYCKRHPDVAASGMSATLHYCLHGAQEGRSPGPDFDASQYSARYREQAQSGLDSLAHYLIIGRVRGANIGSSSLKLARLVEPRARPTQDTAAKLIDVVVPVYRGLKETRACIESVLASSSVGRMRLRIHNDASPEPEVTDYLRALVRDRPEIILVENPVNKGFVVTVNAAMRESMAAEDFTAVVLLNSDTEVANDWLERLFAHAEQGDKVATVTALSNNATICSYPQLGVNELPAKSSTAQMDGLAAEANAGLSVEVPTGVGFCMLITGDALKTIGLFDEEAFGRGYGEENDFCMRALHRGYRNLLALDVFVRHVGEVSFADVSKPGKMAADRIIRQRYPDYHERVSAFVAEDPSLVARLRLTFARWRADTLPVHALVTHALGGGTERHVRETAEKLGRNGHVVILRPVQGHRERLQIENPSKFDGFDVEVEVDVNDGEGFARLLTAMGVGFVEIHHILGHGEWVRDGLARADVGYDFIVHDYYAVCPQVTLTTADSRYCGEPAPSVCDACISARPSHGAADIRNWRAANEWLVMGAEHVRTPSRDTANRIERYYGVRPEVRYHEPVPCAKPAGHPTTRKTASQGPYRVVLIGVLANHKGLQVVLDAAAAANNHALPLTFHLIGDPQGDVLSQAGDRLSWTGKYAEADLPRLIEAAEADAFLFASPLPETYSYTLTAAIRTGLPIVATNIGAFPERLEKYSPSRLVPWNIDGEALALDLTEYLRSMQTEEA